MKTMIYNLARPAVAGWVFTAGAIADILSTAPQVENEANPVAVWVFSLVGFWAGAILLKMACALVVGVLCYVRKYPEWFESLLWNLAGFSFLAVALHNLNNIIS